VRALSFQEIEATIDRLAEQLFAPRALRALSDGPAPCRRRADRALHPLRAEGEGHVHPCIEDTDVERNRELTAQILSAMEWLDLDYDRALSPVETVTSTGTRPTG
jgi:hypothetical protein